MSPLLRTSGDGTRAGAVAGEVPPEDDAVAAPVPPPAGRGVERREGGGDFIRRQVLHPAEKCTDREAEAMARKFLLFD